MSFAENLQQLLTNPEFKKQLLADPESAIAKWHATIPEGLSISVEEANDCRTLVFTDTESVAETGEISEDLLVQAIGGHNGQSGIHHGYETQIRLDTGRIGAAERAAAIQCLRDEGFNPGYLG